MAEKKNKNVELSQQLLLDYTAEHLNWRKQAKMNRDYTLNAQWTADEQAVLDERGQAALVINRIFPVVDQKLAMMTARKPGIRVLARGDEDVKQSKVMQYVLDYIWYISDGDVIYKMVVNDSLVTGVGYFYAYIDTYADKGLGEVKIGYAHGEDVFIDPNSRDPLHRDAQHILVVKNLSRAQAKNIYPDKARLLDNAHGAEGVIGGASNNLQKNENQSIFGDSVYPQAADDDTEIISIIERYTKAYDVYYRVIMEDTEEIMSQEEYNDFKKSIPDDVEVPALKFYKPVVRVFCSAGDKELYSYTLNITDYPIIPVSNVITGMPYSMGEPAFLMGQQDMINKFYSLMISHATTSTNPRVFVERGSVEDIDEFRSVYSQPGAILEYNQGTQIPQTAQPLPLPGALYSMTADLKNEIEYTAGIFPLQQGSSMGAPQTYSATLAIEEFGNRRVNLKLRGVERSLGQLFTIVLQMAQNHYQIQKVMRIISDDGQSVQAQTVNQPVRFTEDGAVLERFNDLSIGEYDVIIAAGSTAPSNRWAEMEEYLKMYQAGIVDDIAVLNKSEFPDKDDIIQRKAMLSQATQQIQQLNKALEASIKQIDQLRKKNQNLEMDVELERFKGNLDAILAKTKADAAAATRNVEQVMKYAVKKKQSQDTSGQG